MARSMKEDSPRPKRVPINGARSVLGVEGQEEGFHYCWVNDLVNNADGNVEKYLNAGYDFVTHEVVVGDKKIDAASAMGARIAKAVGNGVTAYLMRCPEEIYLEELDNLEAQTAASEAEMRNQHNSTDDGRYGKVTIIRK